MLGWSAAVLSFMPVPRRFSLSSVLHVGVTLLLCSRTGLVIWVAKSTGRLLDHGCLAQPLPFVKDGDLVPIAQYMILARRHDTVRVTKVKGHATEVDVHQGRVREEDRVGDAEADAAADLGRRHQSELVMDARRVLLNARNH